MILSYTGKGSGAAKLASAAFAELKGEYVPVLSPERAVHHHLPFLEGQGKAVIFGLGNPSDTLKLAEAFKLTGYEVTVVRPPLEGLPLPLASKLEVYDAVELPADPVEASLHAGLTALELALKDAKGWRADRLREDLRDLDADVEIPTDFESIVYTDSMELAALTLAEIFKKPAFHVQHYPGGTRALLLTTSSEEEWIRRLALGRKAKLVSLPYDPLVSPLVFLKALKKVKPYMTSGRG